MDLMQQRVDLGLIDPGNLNRYYTYNKNRNCLC